MKQMWGIKQNKGIWRGFFPLGKVNPKSFCLFAPWLPVIASQKKFEAFLGQLVKEMNKTCAYGTKERSAFFFFGCFCIFAKNAIPRNFREKICCELSCLEVVTSLSCPVCGISSGCGPCSLPRTESTEGTDNWVYCLQT